MRVAISERQFNGINPKKFALWCSMASIVMMFAALTSAYIVRKSAGNWLEFQLPTMFFYNTVVILFSSLTLQASYWFFLKGKPALYRGLLALTFVLGLIFLVLQYRGWLQLNGMEIWLETNPSASFVFVITGLHAAHILGGIAALTVAMVHAFKLRYFVSAKRKNRFEMVLNYWHFVDLLWIYLLVFFMVQ